MNMKRLVVDNNVLADFFFGSEDRVARVQTWLRRYPVWIVPDLWRYEFGNVVRSQVCFGGLPEEAARQALRQACSMVTPSPAPLTEEEILVESLQSQLTFYDASYVAHARSLGLELLTRDREILRIGENFVLSL